MPTSLRSQLTLAFTTTSLVVVGIAALVLFLSWRGSLHEFSQVTVDAFGLALVVALGIATVAGLLVGVLMTTLIRRPLESLSVSLHRHGHQALEGHAPGKIIAGPYLPEEFHSLLDIFNSLLDHLARRQSEILAAEAAAEAAAKNLALAVFDSREAKILVRNDRVVLANPAAAALLSMPTNELVDNLVTVFSAVTLTTEAGDELTSEILIEAALQRSVRTCITRADGSQRWAEVHAIEHAGAEDTLLVTGRDITEERRVQELRAEVISLVSHDLRAPLTVITGYLDLLERPLDDERRVAAVSSARVSAQRMSALLEDILSATRAEELFAPVSFAPVDLAAVAEDVASSLEHVSAHVMHARARGPVVVLGEERRLRQALVNLVTNAIRHTPDTGEIFVAVEHEGERVLLSVEDTGPGVPLEDRERVFERFISIGHGVDQNPGGFGLGLYIVKAIVESHGGRVWTEDRAGGPGARFVISLPAAPTAPQAPE